MEVFGTLEVYPRNHKDLSHIGDKIGIFLIKDALEQNEVLFSICGYENSSKNTDSTNKNIDTITKKTIKEEKDAVLEAFPISKKEYHHKFKRIREAFLQGDSFLANLTIPTKIKTNLSLEEIYHKANALYKIYVPGKFVCYSPEHFVKIDLQKLKIETYPMKGTIDAAIPNAKEIILNDYKEGAEHYTIVDLMRNDLAQVGTGVKVEKFRYIDRLKTQNGELLQVSSKISANLNEKEAKNRFIRHFE